MTLNAEFLREDRNGRKLELLAAGILREKPDVITMQKVYRASETSDHPAERLAQLLEESGLECSWIWANAGGSDRNEGTAILCSGRKIRNTDQFPIGRIYHNQNTSPRTALGVQLEGVDDWFYSLSMNAWEDQDECFLEQWKRLNCCIAGKRLCSSVWLTGDFNAPADLPDQSYQHMLSGGWLDTYRVAQQKDRGITRLDRGHGIRSDYIFCNQKKEILSSRVIFDGVKEPSVSNHFGIIIEVKEQTA